MAALPVRGHTLRHKHIVEGVVARTRVFRGYSQGSFNGRVNEEAVVALISSSMEEGAIAVSFLQIKNFLTIERKDEGRLRRLLEELSKRGGPLVKAGDTLYSLSIATIKKRALRLPLQPQSPSSAPRPVPASNRYRSLRPGAGLD